jgi:hypothetical protein
VQLVIKSDGVLLMLLIMQQVCYWLAVTVAWLRSQPWTPCVAPNVAGFCCPALCVHLQLTHDGRWLTTTDSNTVRVWDAANLSTPVKTFTVAYPLYAASYCPTKVGGLPRGWVVKVHVRRDHHIGHQREHLPLVAGKSIHSKATNLWNRVCCWTHLVVACLGSMHPMLTSSCACCNWT